MVMYPSYLNLSQKELEAKIEKLFKKLENCEICPRKCRVNRLKNEKGFCQLGNLPMDQYYPCYKASHYPELKRKITQEEYKKTIELAKKFKISLYHFLF